MLDFNDEIHKITSGELEYDESQLSEQLTDMLNIVAQELNEP